MRKEYAAPTLQELGSLPELTAQPFNKVGDTPDTFSQITNGAVIGSLQSAP